MKSNLIDIAARLVHETEKAILVETEMTKKPIWLPKSSCELDDGTLTLPEPLALDKGLI